MKYVLGTIVAGLIGGLLAAKQVTPITRWQYYSRSIVDGKQWKERLDSIGAEGWELVASDQGQWYFKRLLP